jgi:hypothetical protein
VVRREWMFWHCMVLLFSPVRRTCAPEKIGPALPGTSDVLSPDIGRSSWRGKGDPTSRGWPTHFRRPRQRGPDSIGKLQSLNASRSKSSESDFCATSRRGSYQTAFLLIGFAEKVPIRFRRLANDSSGGFRKPRGAVAKLRCLNIHHTIAKLEPTAHCQYFYGDTSTGKGAS